VTLFAHYGRASHRPEGASEPRRTRMRRCQANSGLLDRFRPHLVGVEAEDDGREWNIDSGSTTSDPAGARLNPARVTGQPLEPGGLRQQRVVPRPGQRALIAVASIVRRRRGGSAAVAQQQRSGPRASSSQARRHRARLPGSTSARLQVFTQSILLVNTSLMSLGSVLLGVLAETPAHGYDLKHAHDNRFPSARPLAYGQVYSTLSRLERDGFVELLETTRGSGPDRTVYAITDTGRRELGSWLTAVETPGPYSADELVRKTITALHLGADAGDFLKRQRAAHLAEMRRLTAERERIEELGARLAIDHTLSHLDADLRWLEETRERAARDVKQGRIGRGAQAAGRTGGQQ
jgi:DNA-binding PadR family transcriptional regulator